MRVVTHRPHASDKFDGATGDIEEFRDYESVAADEVSVRDDWKNWLADFASKKADAKLPKYTIFASSFRKDPDLYRASNLVNFFERLNSGLAIVDLTDFFWCFVLSLSAKKLNKSLIALMNFYAIGGVWKGGFHCEISRCNRSVA